MKKILLSLAFSAAAVAGAADTWSLDSCISYALDHNLQVRRQAIEQQSGELSVTEAYDRFLPQLSAGASQSWSFGRGLTSENTYANRNTTMTGFNANLSLPLFQGLSAIRQVDYARTRMLQIVEQTESMKDDITLNVIAQYLQVLYAGELVEVAREQAALSAKMLERQEALLEAGKVPEADVLQARAQAAADELTVVTSSNDRSLALIDLARILELDDVDNFDIAPLDGEARPRLIDADEVYRHALQSNHGILAARRGIDVAQKSISVAKTGYIPRLSFTAGLGSSYYSMSGVRSESFGSQMRDNFSKSLGFSLSVPIFDGFSTRNQVRRARVEELSATLALAEQESQLFKNIRQAYYQAISAAKKMEASKTATEASRAALEAITYKYEYGKANATEYEQAKTAYIKSQSETVQARYELLLRNRILLFYNK
ncbi:MAG: TolC family protein [Duncaniella sp.]|nr:TolC family protein [Duncaniella sp.]